MSNDLKPKPGETKQEMGLRMVFVQKLLELMTAAFSLVAALAWNDAVQALFLRLFGSTSGVIAKFIYALIITALVVLVIYRLSKLTQRIEKNSIKSA